MASISSNFGSFQTLTQLKWTEEGLNKSQSRLSSGERLERSKDAPDEFATASQIRSEIKVIRETRKSSFDAIGFSQIAEGALGQAESLIHRAMELTTAAASETLGPESGPVRQAYNTEYQEILDTLNKLNDDTKVNDKLIFGGNGSAVVINLDTQVRSSADQVTLNTTPVDAVTLGMAGFDISTTAGANAALASLGPALENINSQREGLGIVQRRLERNIDFLNQKIDGFTENESRIRDANIADEVVKTTTYQMQNQSNLAVISQSRISHEAVLQLLA